MGGGCARNDRLMIEKKTTFKPGDLVQLVDGDPEVLAKAQLVPLSRIFFGYGKICLVLAEPEWISNWTDLPGFYTQAVLIDGVVEKYFVGYLKKVNTLDDVL